MASPSFAIVDEDGDFASMTTDMARRHGFVTHAFTGVAEAAPWLSDHDPDLTLLDMQLADGTGFDLLDRLPVQNRGQIVFVSGSNDIEHLRRAVSSSASAYFSKPLPPTQLLGMLNDVKHSHRAREAARSEETGALIGESALMRGLRQELARAAPHDISVLLHGETGSGKELAARALHAQSGRSGRFVAVNCGALPAELLASQLFGHERGSFTGANSRHLGFFEQAQGGTLFLDEIGEMPQALQVYLLRTLETGVVQRLGGNGEVAIDVRIVAATHRLLDQDCTAGLRPDLYYRLARYPIAVPPLRARGEDIEMLVHAFIERMNRDALQAKRMDPRCLPALLAHDWPGNVRELAGAVELAYLRGNDEWVRPAPLPGLPRTPGPAGDQVVHFQVGMTFQQIEAEMLRKTLAFHGGDKTATARSLGVSVRTIHNHLARGRVEA